MDNPKSAARREILQAAIWPALAAALLVAVLFITHPIAENLLIGLTSLPLLWTLHLATGFDPNIKRARGVLRAAAFAVLVFAAVLVSFASRSLQVLFVFMFVTQVPEVWRWLLGRDAPVGE